MTKGHQVTSVGLTQERLASRMKTTRTLERYARATGHKLRITLEPARAQ